jgi:CheY-like chemotaxis protein
MTTILVVDDEPTIRALVIAVLEQEGNATLDAADGHAALAALAQIDPDLVLMDVMMPGLDGHAVYQAMRADPRGRGIPVILMSAAADPAQLPRGIAGFLPKPFDLDRLLTLVAGVLGDGPSGGAARD